MINETISFPFGGKNNATLTILSPAKITDSVIEKRPTVLVIPGGAYKHVSEREGECVALRFVNSGFNAALLSYSIEKDAKFPQPLCEAALAMAYLKENADRYCIDRDRIYTCGFSAGGHLALSLGVFWDKEWLSQLVGKENELLRPTAQIICYPVVSSDPAIWHEGTILNALGDEDTPERRELISLDKQVSSATPPTFLWTTRTDQLVPCENSLLLLNKLQENGILTEFHMYAWGRHGLSLANRLTQIKKFQNEPWQTSQVVPHVSTWMPLCVEWLEELFGEDKLPQE